MQSALSEQKTIKKIRIWIGAFMLLLVLSGITAIPLEWELQLVNSIVINSSYTSLSSWIEVVHDAIVTVNDEYPFYNYGFDWLAFGHIVIALVFIGPYKDPVRNKWVIDFGILACLLVLPWALLFGYVRSIPMFWQLIDCSFGILGLVPMLRVRRLITILQNNNQILSK